MLLFCLLEPRDPDGLLLVTVLVNVSCNQQSSRKNIQRRDFYVVIISSCHSPIGFWMCILRLTLKRFVLIIYVKKYNTNNNSYINIALERDSFWARSARKLLCNTHLPLLRLTWVAWRTRLLVMSVLSNKVNSVKISHNNNGWTTLYVVYMRV